MAFPVPKDANAEHRTVTLLDKEASHQGRASRSSWSCRGRSDAHQSLAGMTRWTVVDVSTIGVPVSKR